MNRPPTIRRALWLFSLFLTALFLTLPPAVLEARSATAVKTVESVNQELLKGINLLYNWHYDEADALFQRLAKLIYPPLRLAANFLQLARQLLPDRVFFLASRPLAAYNVAIELVLGNFLASVRAFPLVI